MTSKQEFIRIAEGNIKRTGIAKILESLEKSDFYTAPASTRFHDSEEGGLVNHSVKVFKELVKLDTECKYTSETLAIVALFHDLCKIGYYVVDYRNTKDESGKWIKVPYYTVNDKLPLGHGEKSCILVLANMELTPEETMAIRWHMGGFEPKENYKYLSDAYSEYPLAVMLHMADLKATYVK